MSRDYAKVGTSIDKDNGGGEILEPIATNTMSLLEEESLKGKT